MSPHHARLVNVRFSSDGRHAAGLAVTGSGAVWVEGFTLTPGGPRRRLRAPIEGDREHCHPEHCHAVPLPDGRLLWSSRQGGRQWLTLIGPGGVLASRPVPPLRLAAAPPGSGLALALTTPAGATQVRLIGADLDPDESIVAEIPATVAGPGVVTGDRMVLPTREIGPVLLDPATGQVAPLPLPRGVEAAVPLAAAGDTLLVGVSAGGRHRLATLPVRDPDGFAPMAAVDALAGTVAPLALDPTGTEVVLRVRRGIRSRLLRHRPATGQLREIAAPPGTAAQRAAWTVHGLWLPYSTTTAPAGLWWLPPGGAKLHRPPGGAPPAGPPGRVETLPGPAGPVEAVVYGDWRASERVVLALHGGPAEHWPLAFDACLAALASAGLAVVAPNPRGSTGYGRAYQEALKGAWGGPDLADIVAIGAHLATARSTGSMTGRRRRPALYGASYGAFLGLLAMADAPWLWSGCVAVAPFLSAARLYPTARPPVRALLDRLDGTATVTDRLGPRDLLRLAPQIRGRVLVVHGERDATIPVAHSRELVAALASRPGIAVSYRELAGRDHQPVRYRLDAPEFAEIVRFLSGAVSVSIRQDRS